MSLSQALNQFAQNLGRYRKISGVIKTSPPPSLHTYRQATTTPFGSIQYYVLSTNNISAAIEPTTDSFHHV